MTSTKQAVLTAAEMRAAELATAEAGTPLAELMERAGKALADLVWRVASGRPVHIVVGPGNNGGDGYVTARRLEERGASVRLFAFAPPASDLARDAAARWGGKPAESSLDGAVLVDCLFGTGLNRPLDDDVARWLAGHARGAARIVAADLPSGVDTDTGALLGAPLRADVTLAFGALKPGHLLYPAADQCGRVEVADIGVAIESVVHRAAMPALDPPGWRSHKYTRGLVAVVAGRMPGAAELAARAAQRTGAGYVRLIGSAAPPTPPFALVRQGWRDGEALGDDRIGAVVIGPGLGQDDTARDRLTAALAIGKPLVLDADALALIDAPLHVPAILTPHAGEFARMGGRSECSKIEGARELARRFDAVVIHKGAETVIASPDGRAAVQSPGFPWLSSAGTGDVLAGVCGAMLARGLEPFAAAEAAVMLHQRAALRTGPGLIADDMLGASGWS